MTISENLGKYQITIDDEDLTIRIYDVWENEKSFKMEVKTEENFDQILKVFATFREIKKLREKL